MSVHLRPLLGALALGSLLAPAAAQTANPDRVYAIKDAKVLLADGRTLEKATLLLREGRIEAAGEGIAVPFDAETIDGTGLTAAPAFLDAFATLGVKVPEGASPSEAPGVDTSVTVAAAMPLALRRGLRPEFSAAEAFSLDEAGGRPHREAGFGAALVGAPGGMLAGRSALVLLSGGPRRDALLRASIAIHGAFQSSGGGYPSTKMGVLAVLRQAFLDAAHAKEAAAFYERRKGDAPRPPHDDALEAISEALEDRIPIAIEADDADEIRRAIALAKEFGFRLWISGGREAWKVADLLKEADVPVLLGLDFGREPRRPGERRAPEGRREAPPGAGPGPKEEALESGAQSPPQEKAAETRPAEAEGEEEDEPKRVLEDRIRRWEERVACAARLQAAGVRFALTTEGCRNPAEFATNLGKAIEKGLAREAALAALTTAPARLFGFEGRLGAIAPGRIANVVLWKGEPLAKDAKPRFAFVDGTKFDLEAAPPAAAGAAGPAGPARGGPPAAGINLTGTWEVSMEGGRLEGSTWTLKQDGSSLTGQAAGRMGSVDLSGSISGAEIELAIEMSFGERTVTIRLEGKAESNDRLSGTVRAQGRRGGGGGKWTATRKGPGSLRQEGR